MAVKIQLRRDLATNWGGSTVLASGEVGYETDTGNIKIGDGTTQWSALAYYQLPNVSVNPATTADLNNAAYRVMGRYRLNSVTSGSTFTNAPSDLDTADADSYCAMIVTSHAYTALSTLIQQTLTQFSGNNTALKQWVRMYDGTNWTAWTSTAHLSDSEVTTAKIADDAVTAAKLADDASTDGNRAVTTNHIRDSAVTTAKIADANVTTAKIADSSSTSTGVTNAKIRQSNALSVIGRSANTTGAPADIQATAASGAVLRESGSTIGFGTVGTAGIADDAITAPKINMSSVQTNVVAASVHTQGVVASATAASALASMVEITPLTTSITPSTTASNVFVNMNICGESDLGDVVNGYGAGFVLTRTIGTTQTNLGLANAGGPQQPRFMKPIMYDNDGTSTMNCYSIQFLDSPNTTSPCTYKLHYYGYSGDTRSWKFYLNRTVDNFNDAKYELGSSQVILIEMY